MDLFDSKNIPEDRRYVIVQDDLCDFIGDVWTLHKVITSGDREYFSFIRDTPNKEKTREFVEEHLRGETSIGLDTDTRLQLVAESSISDEDKFYIAFKGYSKIDVDS